MSVSELFKMDLSKIVWDKTKNLKLSIGRIGKFKFIQQNPHKDSKWAQLAREGHDVTQVLENGVYVGVIVDGKFTPYQ